MARAAQLSLEPFAPWHARPCRRRFYVRLGRWASGSYPALNGQNRTVFYRPNSRHPSGRELLPALPCRIKPERVWPLCDKTCEISHCYSD